MIPAVAAVDSAVDCAVGCAVEVFVALVAHNAVFEAVSRYTVGGVEVAGTHESVVAF